MSRVSSWTTEKLDLILKDVRAWCELHGHREIARLARWQLSGQWNLHGPELKLPEWRQEMSLRSGSERDLQTVKLYGEMGKILRSFESLYAA